MRYAPTIDKGHLFQYRLVAVLEKAHEMSNWEATMLQSSYKSTHTDRVPFVCNQIRHMTLHV